MSIKEKIYTMIKTGRVDANTGHYIEKPIIGSINIDFKRGMMVRRKSWRTFEEMVKVLLEMNDRWKKEGHSGQVKFTLPLNHSTVRKVKIIRKK